MIERTKISTVEELVEYIESHRFGEAAISVGSLHLKWMGFNESWHGVIEFWFDRVPGDPQPDPWTATGLIVSGSRTSEMKKRAQIPHLPIKAYISALHKDFPGLESARLMAILEGLAPVIFFKKSQNN